MGQRGQRGRSGDYYKVKLARLVWSMATRASITDQARMLDFIPGSHRGCNPRRNMAFLQKVNLLEVSSKQEFKCRFSSKVHVFSTVPSTFFYLKKKKKACRYDQVIRPFR